MCHIVLSPVLLAALVPIYLASVLARCLKLRSACMHAPTSNDLVLEQSCCQSNGFGESLAEAALQQRVQDDRCGQTLEVLGSIVSCRSKHESQCRQSSLHLNLVAPDLHKRNERHSHAACRTPLGCVQSTKILRSTMAAQCMTQTFLGQGLRSAVPTKGKV